MKKCVLRKSMLLGSLMAFVITGSAFAAIPANLDSDFTGTGAHYVSSDIKGNGHSVSINGEGAKLQISQGSITDIKNMSVTNEAENGLFNQTGGTLALTGSLTADSAYVRNAANFSATNVTVKGEFGVLNESGVANISNTLTAGSLKNAGTTSIGSVDIKGGLSNSGTLTVKNEFNVGGSLTNSGTLYLNAGKLDFPAMNFTNSGTLKKNETADLDSITLNSLRNKATLAAGTINVTDYIFNGDQGTKASLSADNINTKTFINYENGELKVNGSIEVSSFQNKGSAILNNMSVAGNNMKNEGDLTVNGKIASWGKYSSNTAGATLTLGSQASFDKNATTEFANNGTVYVTSGKLDAQGMTLRNNKGAVLSMSKDQAKLASINVAGVRNEASIQVGELKSAGIVFNGEAGNKSSLIADSISAGSGIINANNSTLKVSGVIETGGFANQKGAEAEVGVLNVSGVVNNNDGAELIVGTADVEWIDNATGALFKGDDVTVARMLNENDATLDVEKLNMKSSLDGEVPRLQLYSTAESHIGSLSGKNIRTTLKKQSGKVHIDNVEAGSSMDIYVPDTQAGRIEIGNNAADRIDVIGFGSITDSFGEDVQSGMQSLADTVTIKGGNGEKNITAEAGKIYGEINGKTDSNGNVVINDTFINQYNQGISEMASISLMTWRQENNDMNKRLGELRNSNGEHGIWTRMTRGESKYGNQSIKNQYNSYQIGYDEKLSTNKAWTIGAALTYTDGESYFNEGTGENTHKGMAVYGSYLGEDGSFVDIIAKYARLEHEFDVAGGAGKGDYDTNGYSISAEYGKRFEQGDGFWFEPQVELTYGKVSSASYLTSEEVHVNQDAMESLVGRVGFSFGKDIKQGNVYVRASYLYDFDGETNVNYSYKGVKSSFEQDLGGGWFEVGVGTNYNLSDATYLYFDVEKTYGGDVATPWQWNAGVRYSF